MTSHKELDWFPKQFGPGDIDGTGAKRLLGTPNIEPAEVLVRETAQNSWDARGKSKSIDFILHLRRLSPEELTVLRSVFPGEAPKTGIPELLRRDEVWVLEISDRGTVGLGGPIRNDKAYDDEANTNFIDLIFNIGAPRDVELGGGTYGFGKTISYVVSGVGAVLVWSRCEHDGATEDRLIGCAIGERFNMDGRAYTGRHWWGRTIQEERRVEPVVGADAESIGNALFASRFDPGATGTSLMILDPDLGGESREEDAAKLIDAVAWNLWPKLMKRQAWHVRMDISVLLDGQQTPLPSIERHPVLSGSVSCLRAVRAVQRGQPLDDLALPLPVDVREIRSERPNKLLGHLALTRFPAPKGAEPAHSVALMRQAELVVRSEVGPALDIEGFQWAGVFRPVKEVDDSFAESEPPAHDDWIPQGVKDKAKRRDVNIALNRIKDAVREFVNPIPIVPHVTTETLSAAIVGDMLADLVGDTEGSAPSTRTPATREGKRSARPAVRITSSATKDADTPGWVRTSVELEVTGAGLSGALVEVAVRVGVDGGSEEDDDVLRPLGWSDGPTGNYMPGQQRLTNSEQRSYVFEARADLAVDVTATLVDA